MSIPAPKHIHIMIIDHGRVSEAPDRDAAVFRNPISLEVIETAGEQVVIACPSVVARKDIHALIIEHTAVVSTRSGQLSGGEDLSPMAGLDIKPGKIVEVSPFFASVAPEDKQGSIVGHPLRSRSGVWHLPSTIDAQPRIVLERVEVIPPALLIRPPEHVASVLVLNDAMTGARGVDLSLRLDSLPFQGV